MGTLMPSLSSIVLFYSAFLPMVFTTYDQMRFFPSPFPWDHNTGFTNLAAPNFFSTYCREKIGSSLIGTITLEQTVIMQHKVGLCF